MGFTSDDLVAGVRRQAFLPDAGGLSDVEILALADDEIEPLLAARMKSAREEFWSKYEDVSVSAGVRRYRFPRRALGRSLRSIALVSLSTGAIVPIDEIDSSIAASWVGISWQPGMRGHYYVEDDFIVFPYQPPTGYSIRFRYLRQPSKLVPVSSALPIAKWVSANELAVSISPAGIITLSAYMDVVHGEAPFDLSYIDALATDTETLGPLYGIIFTGTTFASTDFVDLTAINNDRRDYLCLRDQTVYPQLPAELHPVLKAAVARRVLEVLGDRPGAELAQATLKERAEGASAIIEPRNQDKSRPLVNRSSALRGARSRGRGRGWWPGR